MVTSNDQDVEQQKDEETQSDQEPDSNNAEAGFGTDVETESDAVDPANADTEVQGESDADADAQAELAAEGFEEDTLPPELEAFLATLTLNEEGEVEGLEEPASLRDIEAAEKRLGVSLPPQLRTFLSFWNGGSIHDVCIFGVCTDDDFDIVEFNNRAHGDDFPKELIAFATTVMGDIFCFQRDWSDAEDEHVSVFLFDLEDQTAIEVAPTFNEWLLSLPSLDQEVVAEVQQPQPMSIEEWESFVERERAKLRRLSKTPARDLYMPDPDAIRAELKNKIPVDPRHLKPKA